MRLIVVSFRIFVDPLSQLLELGPCEPFQGQGTRWCGIGGLGRYSSVVAFYEDFMEPVTIDDDSDVDVVRVGTTQRRTLDEDTVVTESGIVDDSIEVPGECVEVTVVLEAVRVAAIGNHVGPVLHVLREHVSGDGLREAGTDLDEVGYAAIVDPQPTSVLDQRVELPVVVAQLEFGILGDTVADVVDEPLDRHPPLLAAHARISGIELSASLDGACLGSVVGGGVDDALVLGVDRGGVGVGASLDGACLGSVVGGGVDDALVLGVDRGGVGGGASLDGACLGSVVGGGVDDALVLGVDRGGVGVGASLDGACVRSVVRGGIGNS